MSVRTLALLVGLTLLAPGCAFDRATSNTARTATEQLLITESARRAVEQSALPDVAGRSVTVTATSLGGDADVGFAKTALEARVRRAGGTIVAEGADMTLNAMISTVGTDDRRAALGFPEITTPTFAVPGLYIFDFNRQLGFTKMTIDATDGAGKHIISTPPVLGTSHFNAYTWFLLFAFRSDDVFQDGYDWHFGIS